MKNFIPPLVGDLQMIDVSINVLSLPLADTPQWIKDHFVEETEYDDVRSMTFFYHPGADAVVLIRDHPHADIYELLVTTYLSVDDSTRDDLKKKIPLDVVGSAVNLLDQVLERRKKIA